MKKIVLWIVLGLGSIAVVLLGSSYFARSFLLLGEEEVTISYGEEYVDPGYVIKGLNSKKIEIQNTVDTTIIGKYTVTYIYHGLFEKRWIRTVTVVDQIPPVITLKGEVEASICPMGEYQEESFIAIDEYDGDLTDKVVKVIEQDRIIYSVEDSSHNKVEIVRSLRREDIENPMIMLKGLSTVYVKQGSSYQESGYTVSDNCSEVRVDIKGNVNTNTVGTYRITYTAKDGNNQTSSITRTVVVYNNDTSQSRGVIYLTFDDGPKVGTTDQILDILRRENIKATFFVTGQFANTDELIRREYQEGHAIGLHTYSHRYAQVYASIDAYFNDLYLIQNRVKNITGYTTYLLRFPGGSSNTISKHYSKGIMTKLSSLVKEKGFHYFDWNVVSGDTSCSTSDCVYNNVIKGISKDKTNFVLLHDIKNTTVSAIERIIAYGKANGYRFEKITMDTPENHHSISN